MTFAATTDMVRGSRIQPSLFGEERRPDTKERQKLSLGKVVLYSFHEQNMYIVNLYITVH